MRTFKWAASIAAILALQSGATAMAQSGPVQDPATSLAEPVELDDVIVEGRRLEQLSEEFVREVSAPPNRRGLARWRGGICVAAVNLQAEVAQPLIDHISRVALGLGLSPRDPGCTPNIVVVFTTDADAISSGFVDARRRAFHSGVGGLDRGRAALEEFKTGNKPVRWWHTSIPTNAYTGGPGIRLPGMEGAPRVPGEGIVNRGRWIRDDLNRVVIVVDIDAVANVTAQQLADYLALVALAQVDPNGQTSGFSTVLNLFDKPEETPGMSGWDRAYLDALYDTPSQRIRDSDQTRQLLRNLRRAPEQAETDDAG